MIFSQIILILQTVQKEEENPSLILLIKIILFGLINKTRYFQAKVYNSKNPINNYLNLKIKNSNQRNKKNFLRFSIQVYQNNSSKIYNKIKKKININKNNNNYRPFRHLNWKRCNNFNNLIFIQMEEIKIFLGFYNYKLMIKSLSLYF